MAKYYIKRVHGGDHRMKRRHSWVFAVLVSLIAFVVIIASTYGGYKLLTSTKGDSVAASTTPAYSSLDAKYPHYALPKIDSTHNTVSFYGDPNSPETVQVWNSISDYLVDTYNGRKTNINIYLYSSKNYATTGHYSDRTIAAINKSYRNSPLDIINAIGNVMDYKYLPSIQGSDKDADSVILSRVFGNDTELSQSLESEVSKVDSYSANMDSYVNSSRGVIGSTLLMVNDVPVNIANSGNKQSLIDNMNVLLESRNK